jgi:hypothetical protein
MSESEIYAAQGRAHADLKKAKSTVATIHTSLSSYEKSLTELSKLVGHFLADPDFVSPSRVPISTAIKTASTQLPSPEEVSGLVDELISESSWVKQFQEQVDKF